MKNFSKLRYQLTMIILVAIIIIIISLYYILPNKLLPIYEENIYSYLKQPLNLVDDDINNSYLDKKTAYIYVRRNETIVSTNIDDVISDLDVNNILGLIKQEYGKIKYKNKSYYYFAKKDSYNVKIAITDDSYIRSMKKSIFNIIAVIVGISFMVTLLLIFSWSNHLIIKIKRLKGKIDNISNDDYSHEIMVKENDELYSLDLAISKTRKYLKEQEEYKNQMYQNISHDFKTPITVMKSYLEALEDGIETEEKTLPVLKEQLTKLELKVHSLLFLNKLNYMKDKHKNLDTLVDVSIIIDKAIQKFKLGRPDIEYIVHYDKNDLLFRGSNDMWEAIVDNILQNFMRYAKTKIVITVKNKKIILFNDGEDIDKKILNSIFTPYEKGINGMFGLGLSIVKKTLIFLNYDVKIINEKKGVKFIIE